MTGPSLSVSLATALPAKVAAPSLLALSGAPDGTVAVPGLAAFLDLMIGQQQVAAKDDEPAEEWQDNAAPGNSLPDKDDEQGDPALAWLLTAMPPMQPTVEPAPPVAKGGGDTPAVAPGPGPAEQVGPQTPGPQPITAASAPVIADAATQPAPVEPVAITPPTPGAQAAVEPVGSAPVASTAEAKPAPTPVGKTPVSKPRPDLAVATPAAEPVRVALPQKPSVALAAAITARSPMPALFALAQPARDEAIDRDTPPLTAAAAAATLLTPTDAVALVAQPGEAQRQALDMGQRDWPQKMIDRIEALRDDANANDTSIRLKPEALGRIDVSLKTHSDGAISVRFSAEQPATRSLIADAQPQLQAAAEAKGIRLSGTSVDLANSGNTDGNRPRPQAELPQNTTNRLAATGEAEAVTTDGRIA